MNATIAQIIRPTKWVNEWTVCATDVNGESVPVQHFASRAEAVTYINNNNMVLMTKTAFNQESELRYHRTRSQNDQYCNYAING